MKRYFTPEQATRLIPRLEEAFEKVLAYRSALDEVAVRLPDLPFEELETPDHAVVADLTDRLNHELAKVEALGAIVEAPEIGLVDFPALLDGQEVLLCWRLGEGEVAYWHPRGQGLTGRHPIEDRARFHPR